MVQEIPKSNADNTESSPILDPVTIEQLALTKVKSLMAARGEFVMPCIPSLSKPYINQIQALLRSLGQNFTPEEIEALGGVIETKLSEGFQASPYARLVFRYGPPEPTLGLTYGLRIQATVETPTTEDKYQSWVQTRTGPLFGSHPDAKVMAIANELGAYGKGHVLDVGAGPGRNSIPLAQLGYAVDALELAPVFAEQLKTAAVGLPINVIQGDVLSQDLSLLSDRYQFIVAAELISHFRELSQVRLLFERMAGALQPGGLFLFSTFVSVPEFQPSAFIRELSQVAWSFILTPSELQTSLAELPLEVILIESAFEYERAHLPSEVWPPTKWYPSWATGRDLFPTKEQPPMSLQWILCRKLSS